jgi:tetratricopeptide (TPR) repeat protein
MKKRMPAVIALLALFLGAGARLSSAADLVVVDTEEGKRQVMCTILEETYRYIKVKSQEETRTLYTDPKYAEDPSKVKFVVQEVSHGQYPPEFAQADMKRRNRQYAEAFEGYKEAVSEVSGDNMWLAPYIWYYAGEAAFNEAKYAQVEAADKQKWYNEAADKYGKLVEQMKDHYFVPDARLGLGKAQLRLDQFPQARQTLKAIIESDYPDDVKLKARVWSGRLMVEQGQFDEAIEKLQALQQELGEGKAALTYMAKLAEAYAWQGKEKYPRAEDLFQEVGLRSPVEEMRAEAYNSRGLSLKKRGQAREALFSFLRVVVLHHGIRHEYQKALYHAAVTSKEYYSNAPQRARELGSRLAHRFPNSYWAKRLKAEAPDLAG